MSFKFFKVNYCIFGVVLLFGYITGFKSSAQLLMYSNSTNGALASAAAHTTGTGLMQVNGSLSAAAACSTGFTSSNFSTITSYNNNLAAVETTITPDSGYILNVTGFAANIMRSSSGPTRARFAYSIDGGISWVAQSINQLPPIDSCGTGTSFTWALNTTFTTASVLKFRITGFNAKSITGIQRIINLMINGTVIPITSTCDVSLNITATGVTHSSAILNWNQVTGAINYKVQYRAVGASKWTTLTTSNNTKVITGLSANTPYQFHVKTNCAIGPSAYSPLTTFTTEIYVPLATPDHIVVLILENHSYSSIIGNTAAPNINALANDSNAALFTQSFALTHPSQPNYIHLFSGSNQGIIDNNVPANIPFTTPNLASSLLSSARSFITYSEDLPSVGFNGASSGTYVRKHNPVTNWMGAGLNQVPVTTNQPFTSFPSAGNYNSLPTVSFVVPNQNNDMHNGSDPARIVTGDNWMYNNLNGYIQWAKTHNSLFVLTFDEDDNSQSNQVVTIFVGPMVKPGQYVNQINHHNILRTIEDMYGLPYAGNASTLIDYCWKAGIPKMENNSQALEKYLWNVFPNPASETINFDLNRIPDSPLQMIITDETGNKKGEYFFKSKQTKINTKTLDAGNYFFNIMEKNALIKSGRFIVHH